MVLVCILPALLFKTKHKQLSVSLSWQVQLG